MSGPIALGPSVVVPLLALEVRVFAAKDGGNQGRYVIDAELNTRPAVVARPLRTSYPSRSGWRPRRDCGCAA